MKILYRHIFREFIIVFSMVLSCILVVYLCVNFLQKADSFIKYRASIVQVALFLLYNVPAMITPSLPIAALVATLLSLGNLSRHNEIIAMRAGGVSLAEIVAPVIIGGTIIASLGFINNEFVMPVYTARANTIKSVEIEKRPQRVVFQQKKLWLRGPDNSIANIDLVFPERNEMLGLNIYKLNPDYTIRERITAKSLIWKNGAWQLQDAQKYIISDDQVVSRSADGETYNIVDNPSDLGMIAKSSDEMDFFELWDYVKRLKTSGYDTEQSEVDLYNKLAFPFSSLLMVLIATPLSLLKVRSGGMGKGIALAVFIAFIYWGLVSVGTALGRSGALPPLGAVWIANVLFASTASYILFRMQKTY